jgi:3-hydroxyacyl-CoA dehydrogenase/enoyl-CoA hydratase/3-hydroxybutyryl-CoA epimerase
VVIEAVFEDLKLKQKLLAEVEGLAHEKLIFASNTSALPIAGIAANAKHPERVLGMHFFSPVEKMPLLEIVVTDQTAPWASFRAVQLGQAMGKQVIVVKDSPGFYTTRALAFFLAEAVDILVSGSRIQAIDKALTSFGFPVGPITLIDEVGIDVGVHVLETMHEAFSSRIVMPQGIKAVQESGRMGRKNNKGFYKYIDGKKQGEDEDIYNLIAPRNGGESLSAEDIVERCLLVFINESVRCLEEGILATAYDGDVGAVFGLGFPPFWGGPFKYIDHLGADAVVKRLEALATKYGERFKPAASLVSMAKENKKYFPEEK